jgi:hypothetical protein
MTQILCYHMITWLMVDIMNCYVRFEVFTAVTMKNGVFWVVTLCGSCKNRPLDFCERFSCSKEFYMFMHKDFIFQTFEFVVFLVFCLLCDGLGLLQWWRKRSKRQYRIIVCCKEMQSSRVPQLHRESTAIILATSFCFCSSNYCLVSVNYCCHYLSIQQSTCDREHSTLTA